MNRNHFPTRLRVGVLLMVALVTVGATGCGGGTSARQPGPEPLPAGASATPDRAGRSVATPDDKASPGDKPTPGDNPAPAAESAGGDAGIPDGMGDPDPGGAPVPPAPPAPAQDPPPDDGPGYPNTPRAYAEQVIAAWVAGDSARLADLTTTKVRTRLYQIAGSPPTGWTWIRCFQYCSFYNGDGDLLELSIHADRLEGPRAAVRVKFDPISYPGDALAYVQEFMDARMAGNVARMERLATPDVVSTVQGTLVQEVTDISYGGGGAGLAVVRVTFGSNGFDLHVGTTRLGGPQAILDVEMWA